MLPALLGLGVVAYVCPLVKAGEIVILPVHLNRQIVQNPNRAARLAGRILVPVTGPLRLSFTGTARRVRMPRRPKGRTPEVAHAFAHSNRETINLQKIKEIFRTIGPEVQNKVDELELELNFSLGYAEQGAWRGRFGRQLRTSSRRGRHRYHGDWEELILSLGEYYERLSGKTTGISNGTGRPISLSILFGRYLRRNPDRYKRQTHRSASSLGMF